VFIIFPCTVGEKCIFNTLFERSSVISVYISVKLRLSIFFVSSRRIYKTFKNIFRSVLKKFGSILFFLTLKIVFLIRFGYMAQTLSASLSILG